MEEKVVKRAFLAALALLSTFSFSSPGFAQVDTSKVPSNIKKVGLWLEERPEPAMAPTALYKLVQGAGIPTTSTLCNGLADPVCVAADELYMIANLDPCKSETQSTCIASVWAVDSSGKKIPGVLAAVVPSDSNQYLNENTSLNIPDSHGIGGVWNFAGVKNSAGLETYYVETRTTLFKKKTQARFEFGEINSAITPVDTLSGDYQLPKLESAGGFSGGISKTPDSRDCHAWANQVCYVPAGFPTGYRFGMNIRIGENLIGWFHGRFTEPNITVTKRSQGQEIVVEAEPVSVPLLDFVAPFDEIPQKALDMIFPCTRADACGGRGTGDGYQFVGNVSASITMDIMNAFTPAFKNTATRERSSWSIKKMNADASVGSQKLMQCANTTGTLAGLVTTNALTYAGGPPNYDEKTGSLIYKVSSPSYQSDGKTKASGTYDLAMKSDLARCIYSFSNAPIKAEISIVNEDGTSQIATTTVKENGGWLYMSAKGFHYSSPTLQVKLSQEKSNKTEDAAKTSDNKAAVKPATASAKKSITCVKGKTTKKVVAVNPKCPVGWKKK
jgi:hypothetical protein